MENQLAIYETANKTDRSVFVVIGDCPAEIAKAERVRKKLGLDEGDAKNVVIIDASPK